MAINVGIDLPYRTAIGRPLLFLAVLIALTTAGSCNSETIFKSNFDATAIDQPPAQQQAVGTVSLG